MKEVYKFWLIAFLRTHPSLMFLWHDKRQKFLSYLTANSASILLLSGASQLQETEVNKKGLNKESNLENMFSY